MAKRKLLALVLAVGLAGCGEKEKVQHLPSPEVTASLPPSPSALTQTPAPMPTPVETETPAPAAEVTPTPEPESTFTSLRTTVVDLSDPKTYYDLNIFLSNFSECHLSRITNDLTPENSGEMAYFAFYHNFWNNPATIEDGDYEQFMIDEESGYCYNLRLSKKKARRTINYFLYGEPGLPQNLDPDCGIKEDDDYYYSETTGGDFPGGFVLVDSTDVYNDPLSTLQVNFHVYEPCLLYYLDDKSVYGLRPDEVAEHFSDDSYSVYSGTAMLIFNRNEDGSYSYKLRSYALDK